MATPTYKVKYRRPGGWFWKTLKHVTGDGFIDERNCRFFVLIDGTQIYVSNDSEVVFGPDREVAVRAGISEEVGR